LDPICHTMVGGALASAGLGRWSARGTATLVIAANIPDIDIVAAFVGGNLEWRRGWTHGVLAIAVWPFVLAGAMTLWHRRREQARGPASRFWPLVALSAIGVLTHPFLDYLNNYGLRWLMPFRDRWYYGDSLFIVDPWLYLMLGLGIWLTRRRRTAGAEASTAERPARIGVAGAALYIGLMMLLTALARPVVARELAAEGVTPARLMVTPAPLNPFVRQVIGDDGERYHAGTFAPWSPAVRIERRIAWRPAPGELELVTAGRRGRAFLHWARFPVFTREALSGTDSSQIRVFDLRYSDGSDDSWASVRVTRPGARTGSR